MKNIIYEGKTYQSNELDQLTEDFREYLLENPDAPPFFKARVENDAINEGGEQELWFGLDWDGHFHSVFYVRRRHDCTEYGRVVDWTNGTYKGSITITRLPK